MIIDCISDLHGDFPELEGNADVLIVAGDLTARHTLKEFNYFFNWLKKQNYKHKIVIGGNHDAYLQQNVMYGQNSMNLGRNEDGTYDYYYLCESEVIIDGIKFYGTPWTKTFAGIAPNCKAFTVDGEEMLSKKWVVIPEDTDVLITHSPPYLIGDLVDRSPYEPEHVGSKSLGRLIRDSNIKLNVFGHVHEGYGEMRLERISDDHEFIFVNASIMNKDYESVNKPIRIEI